MSVTEDKRDQRARGRTSSRSHGNSSLPSIADKIPDNQEVTNKAGFLDDGNLILEALTKLGVRFSPCAIAFGEAAPAKLAEIFLPGDSRGHFKGRILRLIKLELQFTTLGDPHGIAQVGNSEKSAAISSPDLK